MQINQYLANMSPDERAQNTCVFHACVEYAYTYLPIHSIVVAWFALELSNKRRFADIIINVLNAQTQTQAVFNSAQCQRLECVSYQPEMRQHFAFTTIKYTISVTQNYASRGFTIKLFQKTNNQFKCNTNEYDRPHARNKQSLIICCIRK